MCLNTDQEFVVLSKRQMLDLWFLNQNRTKEIRKKKEEERYDYCKYWEFELHEVF
jgi:hypothetical protein